MSLRSRIRKAVNMFWRKSYIYIPVIIIVFFLIGFVTNYFRILSTKNSVLSTPNNNTAEYNEIILKAYDNFSMPSVLMTCLQGGVVWMIVFSVITIYTISAVSFTTSNKSWHKVLGLAMIIVAIAAILLYVYFLKSFSLSF